MVNMFFFIYSPTFLTVTRLFRLNDRRLAYRAVIRTMEACCSIHGDPSRNNLIHARIPESGGPSPACMKYRDSRNSSTIGRIASFRRKRLLEALFEILVLFLWLRGLGEPRFASRATRYIVPPVSREQASHPAPPYTASLPRKPSEVSRESGPSPPCSSSAPEPPHGAAALLESPGDGPYTHLWRNVRGGCREDASSGRRDGEELG
jgi:hypothetical protein